MSFTDYLELELLDHILGPGAYTAPTSVWIALSTTTPLDDGTNFTEPAAGAYARVEVVNSPANWPAAAAGQKKNAATVTFPTATAAWGTITYVGIFDAVSGGHLLMTGALGTTRVVNADDVAEFLADSIVVSLT